MKTNKVKKFNPYSRPSCYPKPSKINKVIKTVWKEVFDCYSELRLPDDLNGGTFQIGRVSISDYGNSVEIYYCIEEEVENKNYDKELKLYNDGMEKVKAWELQKEIYNKEQKKKEEDAEYKNYLKLKKKYE